MAAGADLLGIPNMSLPAISSCLLPMINKNTYLFELIIREITHHCHSFSHQNLSHASLLPLEFLYFCWDYFC